MIKAKIERSKERKERIEGVTYFIISDFNHFTPSIATIPLVRKRL